MAQSEQMKTITANGVEKQILDIINPVHDMMVGEWISVAEIVKEQRIGKGKLKIDDPLLLWRDSYAINLMQRWEAITRQPLTKSMFVNSAEKPKPSDRKYYSEASANGEQAANRLFEIDMKEFQAAQSEVMFAGFEPYQDLAVQDVNNFGVTFAENGKVMLWCKKGQFEPYANPTLSDFITEISRYNRTSKTPIAINFTPNIIQKLIA